MRQLFSSVHKILMKASIEGIINEFAILYHARNQFPLHYIVFKQTASHIPHEGNSEQIFSRSGALSDEKGKLDAERLAIWTSIGINYYTFRPDEEKILERYLLKRSSEGGSSANVHADDLGLLHPDSVGDGALVEVLPAADQEQAGPSNSN